MSTQLVQVRFPNRILPYILLSPSLVIVFVFVIIPSIQSLRQSVYRTSPWGNRRLYVGLENYIRVLSSPEHLNSIVISFWFVFFVVVVGLLIGLLVASLANQKLPGLGIYRIFLIWPYALSPAFASLIWGLLMHPGVGPINWVLKSLFGFRFNWLTDGKAALVLICFAATWKMLGYNIVIFLAGLQTVSSEHLEAASIDGAGGFRRFWSITFPILSPVTFFLFIMNTLYAFFDVFGLIDILTMGGPGYATDLLVYRLYRDAFIHFDSGVASAQSILLLILVSGLTLIQFRYVGKRVFYQ